MNALIHCAERTLRDHPHSSLRLGELLDLVAERVDRGLDAPRLRALLEQHPERFRLLEPWRGPWQGSDRRADTSIDPWVVMVSDPDPPLEDARCAATRLRESVRWLGRGIDPRSCSAVGRWYAIAIAERATRPLVTKRAA